MATAKNKNNYIELELSWLEAKAMELKTYCDAKPIDKLVDRVVGKKVTATTEQQIKSIRDTLKDYIQIIEAIDKLREKDEIKKSSPRGNQELSPLEDKVF